MTEKKIKYKLKGHESFYIREGWLRKGIKNVENDAKFFANADSVDKLGVGTNMVKAIRYWLQTTGLTEEKIIKGGKREQYLTPGFGDVINQYDPYFEDIFTLWLIHYKIATNEELATTWYLFFNDFNVEEFTKDELFEGTKLALGRHLESEEYSEKSLKDDTQCIIKTYFTDKREEKNPEENTSCPLSQLGLLERYKSHKGIEYYIKSKPSISKLNMLIVLYIILDNLHEKDSESIEIILNGKKNAGKVLNLDRNMINQYLDKLKSEEYIGINRTAGIDKIYVKVTDKKKILEEYYAQL